MAAEEQETCNYSKAIIPTASIDAHGQDKKEKEQLSTLLAFFVFGALIYAMYSLMIAGAQDILAGTYIQTSMVLVANIGPYVVVTFVAPFFMKTIPYFVRICFVFLTGAIGFIVVVCSKEVEWKLIGIGVASVGYGVGEVSFLALTSYFHTSALSAYSAGTGIGFVSAPLYYTAMTTWFCVSPKITILIMAGMLLLLFVCYYIMDKKHLEANNPNPYTHGDITYTRIQTNDTEGGTHGDPKEDQVDNKVENFKKKISETMFIEQEQLSLKEKFATLKTIFSITMIPLFTAWFSEYVIIQSVLTTLAYTNAPFRPRDHYQYYIFIFMTGEVIGRSYCAVVSYLKPNWELKPTWKQLWTLSIIESCHLLFFVLESWYRFLPGVGITLSLCLTAGIVIGILFNHVLVFFREAFDEKQREFVMGYAVSAMGAGILTAALAGLLIEPWLRSHCMYSFKNSGYCFTRSSSLKDVTSRCGIKYPATP